MRSLLQKFENWLDKKINKLDREHQFLKTSENGFYRWLWRVFFKPTKRTFDVVVNSAPFQAFIPQKSNKVIHVVNLILPQDIKNKDLARRVALTLESIEKAKTKNVTLLACVSDNITRKGWKIHKLSRDAKSELGNKIDSAYLKDMLKGAQDIAKKGDIIFYSNLDCPVHPDIYKNLLKEDESITEFIRRDIKSVDSYEEIFSQPFDNYAIGVDGIAIKKEALDKVVELLPDFVIGEPHWDTAVSGILHQAYSVDQNTHDLYHISHDQQWDDDNLSAGGEHNKRLYRDAVNYGLMEDDLISIKKDCALILLKHELATQDHNSTVSNLRQLSFLQGKVESVFCEYLEGESKFKKHINRISYLPIRPTNKNVKKLNQKSAILNLLRHYFSNHKYIIIALEKAELFDLKKIKQIKDQLRTRNKITRPGYIALKPRHLEDRPFDFFVENKPISHTIRSYSFINDDGLLELFNTYGYF